MPRLRLLSLGLALGFTLCAQTSPAPVTGPKPNTFAQKLVDETMAKHKEIVILVLHIANDDASDYPIIGSNIGRYGKKADEDDLRVIKTGAPNLEVNAAGNHFEVEMQFHDTSKKVIGAVAVVYDYKAGDDKEAFHKKAELIRAEMEKQIKSLKKLKGAA